MPHERALVEINSELWQAIFKIAKFVSLAAVITGLLVVKHTKVNHSFLLRLPGY